MSSRISVIQLAQLQPMQILEIISTENILTGRMLVFADYWNRNDPPNAAQYDVGGLEFDPIKINQECSTYFELMLRDRVNQACRAVTGAFAVGTDLDAIASRYPGGLPRLPGETDDHYRDRMWLSPNTLTPHGVYEAYVFWAKTADPTLRDVQATSTPGDPTITVTMMADGPPVTATTDGDGKTTVSPFPNPIPTNDQVVTVMNYIDADSRRGLTDVPVGAIPRIVNCDYKVRIWFFPGWDYTQLMPLLYQQIATLIENQRWLGFSHTRMAIAGALDQAGVFNIEIDSPAEDVFVDQKSVVVVNSVTLTYAGRGGFFGEEV